MTNLSKSILYEDDDYVVINKPAGLVVHPDGRTEEPSVSEWLAQKFPEAKNVGESMKLADGRILERPGVVHRIDRETSGALILAKTKIGHRALKEQFQNREIEKVYHLFVHGNLKGDRGTINLPIGRSASNFKKRSAQRGARGEMREAVTHFQVLKRSSDGSLTFVEARPKTGRTHQIRVHFKALHHPILGDKLYGPKIVPRNLGEVGQIFNRLALHARAITFKTASGEKVTVEAPYPKDFIKAMDIIG